MHVRLAWVPPLLLSLAACGADGPTPPPGPLASVVIHNQSQFELLELRIHSTPSYASSTNLLPASPMAIESQALVYADGLWYLTFIREDFRGGDDVAYTTIEPVQIVRSKGYRLIVFDESFRLLEAGWVDPELTELPVLGMFDGS